MDYKPGLWLLWIIIQVKNLWPAYNPVKSSEIHAKSFEIQRNPSSWRLHNMHFLLFTVFTVFRMVHLFTHVYLKLDLKFYLFMYMKHQQQQNVHRVRLYASGILGAGARYLAKSLFMTDAPTRPPVQAERSFPPPHRRIASVCRLPQHTFI